MATPSYPYQARPWPIHRPAAWTEPSDELSSQPHRPFSAIPLMMLAAEALLAGGAFWQMQAGVLWEWPLVIVTAYVAWCGLWLIAGASAAGVVVALLSLATPVCDVTSKTLAMLGLTAHAAVLAAAVYLIVVAR